VDLCSTDLSIFWSHLHTAEGITQLIQTGGLLVLILIIFSETGLLVGFFLPGDSLLVTAGVLSIATKDRPAYFSLETLIITLILAAIIGNQCGWWLGKNFGKRIENKPDGWFFKKRNIDEADEYFRNNGSLSLIVARFIPIMRTFVPFVAGMAHMPGSRFLKWNVIGAIIWITSLVGIGHYIGNTPLADKLHKVIFLVIFISFLPLIWKVAQRLLKPAKQGTKV
jgi:membrane-associated protein